MPLVQRELLRTFDAISTSNKKENNGCTQVLTSLHGRPRRCQSYAFSWAKELLDQDLVFGVWVQVEVPARVVSTFQIPGRGGVAFLLLVDIYFR